jgi:hypothetical protein
MSIRGVLAHRADVSRSTTTNVGGMPITSWSTVAEGVPCLLDSGGHEPQESMVATSAQITEADRTGLLMTAPEADVRPADRLTISIPGIAPSSWTVLAYPSLMTDLHSAHHREFRVKEN